MSKIIEIKTPQDFLSFIKGPRPDEGVRVTLHTDVVLWLYDTQEFIDWQKQEPLSFEISLTPPLNPDFKPLTINGYIDTPGD